MENNEFKDVKLPVPVWDEDREVLEYLYNFNFGGEDILQRDNSLINALSNFAEVGLHYSFTSGIYELPTVDDLEQKAKIVVDRTHAHTFEEVVQCLYDFPESFKVTDEDKSFYSEQELHFLDEVQKYLLSVGLKDITVEEYETNSRDRYLNVRN